MMHHDVNRDQSSSHEAAERAMVSVRAGGRGPSQCVTSANVLLAVRRASPAVVAPCCSSLVPDSICLLSAQLS